MSNEYKEFIEDLRSAIADVCGKHEMSIPAINAMTKNEGVFMNLSFYRQERLAVFRGNYLKYAESMGMKEEWINVYFVSPHSGKQLQLMGLDPDGGEWCIYLSDKDGNNYHMSPRAVRTMILSQKT